MKILRLLQLLHLFFCAKTRFILFFTVYRLIKTRTSTCITRRLLEYLTLKTTLTRHRGVQELLIILVILLTLIFLIYLRTRILLLEFSTIRRMTRNFQVARVLRIVRYLTLSNGNLLLVTLHKTLLVRSSILKHLVLNRLLMR